MTSSKIARESLTSNGTSADAPRVGVFSGPARVHDGALQCAGPVAGLTAHRVGLRAPLDRGV